MPRKKTISSKGIKAPMPARISPMLATLTKEVIDDADYLYEIKWDGYRIVAYINNGKVRMDSRGGLDYTSKYPPVVNALKKLKRDAVLDGEVVVFDKEGIPDFNAVQLYNAHNTPIFYCLFDIMWLDGHDLKHLPLTERKNILQSLVSSNTTLRFSESFDDGAGLYQLALDKGLEGVVAKRRSSTYQPGIRGSDWLKIPTRKRQEFVIGGWAESEKARSFRSLLFGAYNNGQLEWIGRSGGGYKEKEMPGILKQLKALETDQSPFVNPVLDTKGATIHWVKPELVANFEFAAWTPSGRIRKPATFLGFRKDKKPRQVVREVPKVITSKGSNWPAVEGQPRDDKAELDIEDCAIELFNVDRAVWKGITKAALIEYYHKVYPYLLTYIKDRPQSLHIKLNGANAPGIYIKDMEGRQPDCADLFIDERRNPKPGKRSVINYLVCNNEPTLLWMVNLGCIDINPWNSRTQTHEEPDYIVIDLDPSEKKRTEKGLQRLRDTAMAANEYCQSKRLTAFIKTSGKTGVHFLVPCSGFNYAEARKFAEHICEEIHRLVPAITTTAVSVSQRGNKVYIDPSQNDYADTIASPYSVRPYMIPAVSTPIGASEIKTLDPHEFTMSTIFSRLKRKGDLFRELYSKKIIASNNKTLKTL